MRIGWSRAGVLIALGLVVAACGSPPARDSGPRPTAFQWSQLTKTDVDMVAEVSARHSLEYLEELARKLYVRNPRQLARSTHVTREGALQGLFGVRRMPHLPELQGQRAAQAIGLAFHEDYAGDRVAALIEGMRTMLLDAYGGKLNFHIPDRMDEQKIYYLARNFEIAFWQLRHKRDPSGQPYLLSNALDGEGDLSFERLAGKLIAVQDHLAVVVAERGNRQIKNVIQGVASAVFFPI